MSLATTWRAASAWSRTWNWPALLGCDLGETGVVVDEYQQSSVAGVYCAGEITGIGGLERALVEGEIAGFAAAGRAGACPPPFRGARRRITASPPRLERAFALRPELKGLPRADTIVCRCEDVTLSAASRPVRVGAKPSSIPAAAWDRARAGSAVRRLEFLQGWTPDSVRPPVLPVSVASLAQACASRVPPAAPSPR